MHESDKHAGNIKALLTGGISTTTQIHALRKDEIEVGELVSCVVLDSATGYVVTTMSKGIIHSTTHLLGANIARTLIHYHATTAIAVGVINTSKLTRSNF